MMQTKITVFVFIAIIAVVIFVSCSNDASRRRCMADGYDSGHTVLMQDVCEIYITRER